MDTNTTIILVVIIFALIIIAVFLVFRQRGKVKIDTPVGKLEVYGSNEPSPPTPGVNVEDAKAKKGGLVAEDKTGRGANVRRVETQDDILVSSTPPDQEPDPKDRPPT